MGNAHAAAMNIDTSRTDAGRGGTVFKRLVAHPFLGGERHYDTHATVGLMSGQVNGAGVGPIDNAERDGQLVDVPSSAR